MDLSEAQKGIATDWTQFLNLARRACPEGSATRKASDFKRAVFGAKLLIFATGVISRIAGQSRPASSHG